jgi:CDP-diacylglycerol--glycerol-3-phosphate 3-phosphatidyltransferase
MNIANKLTLLRVALIPVFLIVMYWGFPYHQYVGLIIFIGASLTDFVDGHLARSRNLVTDFGKFMDPLADKVLVVTAMLWFVQTGVIPAWAVAIVILREFAVSGMRLIAVEQGRVIAAAWSGKIKTASTMVCLCLMFVPLPTILNWICVAVIVGTTVWSGIEYFVKNRDVFSGEM